MDVPFLKHSLLPLLILTEALVQVNSTSKIQAKYPTYNEHSIYYCNDDFTIPLSLLARFSYFFMLKPSNQKLGEFDEVLLLTPEKQLNTQPDVYTRNK